jgi:hypothetical protein
MAGFAAYEVMLRLIWRQSMGGDWAAVAYWSLVALTFSTLLVYTPAMMVVRRILGGYRPIIWFPLVAIVLGVIPTMLIFVANGGNVSSWTSPEARLFYVYFGVFGVIFGLGFATGRHEQLQK